MLKVFGLALWTVAAATTIFIASLPLGVEAQFVLATGCLVAMLVMKTLGLRGPLRPVFLALGIFVVLRYLLWRLSSTLPPIDSPFDFIAGYVLVAAECYCVAMLFLSLFTVADPIDRPKAPRLSDEDAPTVDVFIPTYNEAIDIVAPTVAAAKRMTYPAGKLNVFLLDDGGTDEKLNSDDPAVATRALNRRQSLQAVCDNLGARYLAREENVHAKAGNLNNGLANSEGEIVAVFDADHVPAQDFLTETVGFFSRDENLFLVQTPHFFLNPDPIEKNLNAARMPAENEMFYGLVQKGLDKWNAAFFCGSAALLRREALDSVGGFHGSSVTEDAETALELHSRGWSSLYVDKPMIAGLQPETFEVVHRPALALVPRDGANSSAEEPALPQRADYGSAALLPVQQHVLALSAVPYRLRPCPDGLYLLRSEDIHREQSGVCGVHARVHARRAADSELRVWPRALAMDVRSLRIHPVRHAVSGGPRRLHQPASSRSSTSPRRARPSTTTTCRAWRCPISSCSAWSRSAWSRSASAT